MSVISNLGIQLQSLMLLRSNKQDLANLNEQLATGKRSQDLTDYTATEVKNIINLRGVVIKSTSYISAINAVQPRVKVYDSSLTGLEDVAAQAQRLIADSSTMTTGQQQYIANKLNEYFDSTGFYLNQKVGDRYIFAGDGSRLGTRPVGNLSALPTPPVETSPYTVASPVLPSYDVAAPGNSADAWTKAHTHIDEGYDLTYGITSSQTPFQQLIMGLRLMKTATQDATQAAYTGHMQEAYSLLSNAVEGMRDMHATIASADSTLTERSKSLKSQIDALTNQADDIQRADPAEVATRITFYQTQLSASYSATSSLAQMSLLNYL
ncbi:MAG: hypothetical protein IPI58_00505 [Alphaproteobacteria bacterium]|nr:MAG: hypothetical protein IPI58_00505 [Alphaproteobacteria bacterium]